MPKVIKDDRKIDRIVVACPVEVKAAYKEMCHDLGTTMSEQLFETVIAELYGRPLPKA